MFSLSNLAHVRGSKGVVFLVFLMLGVLLLSEGHATAQAQGGSFPVTQGPRVSPKQFRGDVRDLAQLSPESPQQVVSPLRDIPINPNKQSLPGAIDLPGVPQLPSQTTMPSPIASFKGLDQANWGAGWPPDPVGDVGPNHYIQAVNTSVGIFDKTGTRLAAFTFNTLWSGAGTGTTCDTTHRGDPTVVYDHLADRFYVADFAFAGNGTTPPFYECIAVSKTSDPVAGGWWLYAIRTDDTSHPWLADYPKMGLWRDGLYMTANMFNSSNAFQEVRVWAFDRTDLIAGAPVDIVIADLNTTAYFSLLPSNLRGTTPPAGRENLLVSESRTLFTWEVWKFHVVYGGAGSTFIGPTNVSQTGYTVAPATVTSPANSLDSLAERMMMQNQYRNIGGTESLWVNHTVRTGASPAPAGIQWSQINVTGGTIVTTPVQQQIYGNLSNDGVHRWMGSLAVDAAGNMALGYSASSSTVNPDIRYNGRLSTDALNTLPQGETSLLPVPAGGSQSGNCGGSVCNRWGDYSAMTVDRDGCTFWYTNEYYDTNGLNWQTRIGAFRFAGCTPTAATLVAFTAKESAAHRVRVKWETGTETNVRGFNIYRAVNREGAYRKLNSDLLPAKDPGGIQGVKYKFVDKRVERGSVYFYKLEIVKVGGPSEWSDVKRVNVE